MTQGTIYTHTFKVTTNVYEGFIAISQDRNPLHTDTAFAQAKGFKGRVMHGNILNSFVSYFIGECLPTKDVIIHSQDIAFSQPVYLDDEVTLHAEVTGVFESVNTCEFKFYFKNEAGKKVAKGNIQIGILK